MDVRLDYIQDGELPENLLPGVLYCDLYDASYPWAAHVLCPCGCGDVISLYLGKDTKPGWTLESTEPLTLSPSIQRTLGCRSHFFIRSGKFVMC